MASPSLVMPPKAFKLSSKTLGFDFLQIKSKSITPGGKYEKSIYVAEKFERF
jgi:hypothetical protein